MTPLERDRIEALAAALGALRRLAACLPAEAPLEHRARAVVREVFAALACELRMPPGYIDPARLVGRAAELERLLREITYTAQTQRSCHEGPTRQKNL